MQTSIADLFAARLAELAKQDQISQARTAATVARARRLIAELEEQEARWAAEEASL